MPDQGRTTSPPTCASCGENPDETCPKSQRPCGHHCNHSWTHDACDWCDTEWGEDGVPTYKEVPDALD